MTFERSQIVTSMHEGHREGIFDKYISPTKLRHWQEKKPYYIDFELTTLCPHTCKFCFSNSNLNPNPVHMPKGKVLEVLDDLAALEFKQIYWDGGESLLHPDFFDILAYAHEKGMGCGAFSAGLPLANKIVAKKVVDAFQKRHFNVFGIHIDTLDPETFAELHDNPHELDRRIRGYQNLLDAGFPPNRILPCITLTGPAARTIEKTIDWYVDEMGARFLEISTFKPMGSAGLNPNLEPSLSDMRRGFEYRAQKFGDPTWAQMGSTECTTIQCRTNVYLTVQGEVMRCGQMPRELASGNIYEERLFDIYRRHADTLSMRDLQVTGKCADCKHNDICEGCRAAALHYCGDINAPDPKCWLNPEAQETYLR